MSHKYSPGQTVYFEPQFGNNAARGVYKIVRSLPIERDGRLSYRIKSATESFERIAEGPLLAQGGHYLFAPRMSAFGGKADTT